MKLLIAVLTMTLFCATCGGGSPLADPPPVGKGNLRFVTTSPLPNAHLSQAYSFQMQATGGKGTCSWSATGLPAGLSISSSGLISGTPTQAVKNVLATITYRCSK